MSQSIRPFQISVSPEDLNDLMSRLERTRLPTAPAPTAENNDPWAYGVPLSDAQKLITYWREEYNWRDAERKINETLPQFTTTINVDDGFGDVEMHFVFCESARKGAVPLLFIHGCMYPTCIPESQLGGLSVLSVDSDADDTNDTRAGPGSFLEVSKILSDLTSGQADAPSFHVVAPSLPNFGFSQRINKAGFDLTKYAEVLHKLMRKLGFNEYGAYHLPV